MRIGIDLGGTKMEVVALDEEGRELLRRRAATPRNDYAGTIEAVAGLVREAETELGTRGSVGIGTPGAISTVSGNLKNSNSTWLNDQPLKRDLERALGREIRIANDANCFVLSEAVDGAGAGVDVVFGVILGTGVGGGIVVRHHVLTGANAIAGEWGHNPLPFARGDDHPAPACYCGQHGCIETYLSGPGMARDHLWHAGERLDPPAIVAGAAAGSAACDATLARYEDRLARALSHVINLLDPDVIVLGGGMSNIARLYDRVPRLWQPYVFSDHVATRLVPNRHGDSSGVRGAAWLWS
jgi:predicted NBD/HSP70 family sugar kinase